MVNPCLPLPDPGIGYYCENEDGDPVAVEPYELSDGTQLVQAPLHFCGDNSPVCEDSQVSGCISDTDGAPTSYGPAPENPDPENVNGPSPMMSRVRVNRTGQAVLPYSDANHPDQLIDIVIDGGEDPDVEVPFNPATGRFTLPAYPGMPDVESFCAAGITIDSAEQVLSLPGVTVPLDTTDYLLIETDFATVENPDPEGTCSRMLFAQFQVPTTLINYESPNDALFSFQYWVDAGPWVTYVQEYPTPRFTSSNHGFVGGSSGVLPLTTLSPGQEIDVKIRAIVTTDEDHTVEVSEALASVRLWTQRIYS